MPSLNQYHYWQYYLTLEQDVLTCARFVEFCETNYSVYSIEFTRLLLACCSEVDVIAKELCTHVAPSSKHKNICDYGSTMQQKFPNFPNIQINVPRYGLAFKPWEGWYSGKSPVWWEAYNDVKHNRSSHYSDATLKNALLSLSGLFSFVLYYYKIVISRFAKLSPFPALLDLDKGRMIMPSEDCYDVWLPDPLDYPK